MAWRSHGDREDYGQRPPIQASEPSVGSFLERTRRNLGEEFFAEAPHRRWGNDHCAP